MAQKRGRKSAASLSVVAWPLQDNRPEPPDELTSEQAAEWHAVVARMPNDWFPRESHALLVAFCRHVTRGRLVAGIIAEIGPDDLRTEKGLARYDKLSRIAEREGRAISILATKMRLSHQSRWQPVSAHRKVTDPNASRRQWSSVE
jgi:hypothetical protein